MYNKCITVGAMQTNCYIIGGDDTDSCVIIDPGAEEERITEQLVKDGRKPEAILLTHGHFDHIGACRALWGRYKLPVYIGINEADIVSDTLLNLSMESGIYACVTANYFFYGYENEEFAGLKIRVINTPGHTYGGVCYYIEDEKVLFSGDTLFNMSIGRTDFPTGNHATLIKSIREELWKLPDDVAVYTGHGEPTSIGYEKANNMFVRDE